MQTFDRRIARRFIMKVPLRFKPLKTSSPSEKPAESMNISTRGVYFATDFPVREGLLVEMLLEMPKEIVGNQTAEWKYTGRVAHIEPFESPAGRSGVGVQFLYYELR